MSETTESGGPRSEPADDLEGSNVVPDQPEDDVGETDEEPEPTDDTETRGIPAQLSRQGADFVARFEGVVLHLYNDPTNNATIGVGHLVHRGPVHRNEPAEFRHGITRQRALQLLQQDAGKAVAGVRRQIRVPLKQHQLDALTSFVFNVGEGALQTSTLRRVLNAGNYAAVSQELNKWVFSSGKKLPGLVRRRQAEGRLFSHGKYV